MRTPKSRRALAAWTAAALLATMVATTPTAAQAQPAPTQAVPAPLGAAAAIAQAKATGKPVVADALTMANSQTIANPNGTLTSSNAMRPVRTRRGDTWVNLDPTLSRRADGRFSTAATPSGVSLSGGGDQPMAILSNKAQTVSLTFPAPLPAPTVSGHTATYANVFPDVDLVVNATKHGDFSHTLVVKTAGAAKNPRLKSLRIGVTSPGLSTTANQDSSLTLTDAAGRAAYTAPPALMWDSTPPPAEATAATNPSPELTDIAGGSPLDAKTGMAMRSTATAAGMAARTAPVTVTADRDAITLVPNESMLTDPNTVFPVMIDPTFVPNYWSQYAADWTQVQSGKPDYKGWHQTGPAQIGYCGWPGPAPDYCNGIDDVRSYFQWGIQGFHGTAIYSAKAIFTPTYAINCNSGVHLDWTNAIGADTSWNTMPGAIETLAALPTCNGLSYDVKAQVVKAVNNRSNVATFRLRAANEDTTDGWKKFQQDNATLEVTWDVKPVTPNSPYTSPIMPCTNATPYPGIGKTDVTLSLQTSNASDNVSKPLDVVFTVKKLGTSQVITKTTTVAASNRAVVVLPYTQFTDGDYTWSATATDGWLTSGPSTTCTFHVDTSKPGAPTIASTDYPNAAAGKPMRTPGNFTFSAGPGNPAPAKYRYQLSGGTPVTVNATNGTWSGPITATRITGHTLTVQALNSVGTVGPTATWTIVPSPLATPDPTGDLSGDGKPDILTIGGTAGTAPGLWLTPGNGGNQLLTPYNIGIRGTGLSTSSGKPADWNNTLLTSGYFSESGLNDLMAVLPNGDILIYTVPGDGSALPTHDVNTVQGIASDTLYDPNFTPVKPANNITIKQIVTMGHLPQDTAAGTVGPEFPDLFAVVDNAGSYQLWWFEHLDGIGNYQMPAVVLDSTINWSTKTISGTTRAGKPALVVRDKTTGQVDLYSTNCTIDCANTNWFTDATKTVARPAASALNATNTPVVTSSDTNNDTHPDLWGISATGAASYGAGTSTGTFAAPAAAGTVIPPVTANLRPMGAVNFRNPATNQDETHVYAANAAGQLLDYQKMPSGILGPPTIIGTAGWNAFTPFGIVDWNHDGYPDLLTRHDTFCTEDVFLGSATG
ncbi:hypothetical protein, partial [Actinokineospora sp.]|uniref:hypothetical protein n=1 Tax=Actinokineospora sp. TaxID=1872133 RepID=UPI003D6B65C4